MSQTYGIESARQHTNLSHRLPVRYVVIIEAGGSTVAMLFQQDHALVSEIDAGTDAATSMITGLTPVVGAVGADWDQALAGHSTIERAVALVFTLEL